MLGCKVRDQITGFEGIAIAITTWLNGCVRVTIQPQKLKKDGGVREAETVDINQVKVLSSKPIALVEPHPPQLRGHTKKSRSRKNPPGGPMPEPVRAKDPR